MSGRLFNRKVSLTLARPLTGEYFKTGGNAIVVSDLRVSFSIKKSLHEKPNDCTITVFNLSESTRTEFAKKPLQVQLDAGYDGQMSRIFIGDMHFGNSNLDNVDWVTKLQVADGHRAFQYATISRSYKGGVSLKQAVTDTAQSMGVRIPNSLDDFKEMAHQYSNGLSLTGPSQRQMTKLLKAKSMSWSMQDGQLQVLREGGVRQDQAIVVSQETGMVGTPDFGPPKKPGESPRLSVKMLLYPGLIPGGKVKMDTLSIKGLFRLEQVTHSGDTHGTDWFSSFEAKPL